MHHRSPRLLLLALAMSTCHASPASANIAGPQTYIASVDGNSVYVGAYGHNVECPREGGMLRMKLSDASVVRLDDFCGDEPSQDCYLDECVPPGHYRYGYAEPFVCDDGYAGDPQMFAEIGIASELPEDCTLSAGNDGPSQYTGDADHLYSQILRECDWSEDDSDDGAGPCAVAAPGVQARAALPLLMLACGIVALLLSRHRRNR